MERSKLEKFRQDILSAQTLGLDTMCFIYQFQDNPRYASFTNDKRLKQVKEIKVLVLEEYL